MSDETVKLLEVKPAHLIEGANTRINLTDNIPIWFEMAEVEWKLDVLLERQHHRIIYLTMKYIPPDDEAFMNFSDWLIEIGGGGRYAVLELTARLHDTGIFPGDILRIDLQYPDIQEDGSAIKPFLLVELALGPRDV